MQYSYNLGLSNGLSLILNVEQYEYMKGPQNDAGVKVSADFIQIKAPSWIEVPEVFGIDIY